MQKLSVMQRIYNNGVIAVIRADSADQAQRITDAALAGGIKTIEITMTVPGAIDIIRSMRTLYDGEVIVGAGTVLDAETARLTILAGAQFVVSPYLNSDLIRMCNRYQIVTMPGAMTIADVIKGMEAGGDFIKIFPGSAFGPGIIKSIKGPLPYAPLLPTGGINPGNVEEWIRAGSAAVGVGGELTAGARSGDYHLITETAQMLIAGVIKARNCQK